MAQVESSWSGSMVALGTAVLHFWLTVTSMVKGSTLRERCCGGRQVNQWRRLRTTRAWTGWQSSVTVRGAPLLLFQIAAQLRGVRFMPSGWTGTGTRYGL